MKPNPRQPLHLRSSRLTALRPFLTGILLGALVVAAIGVALGQPVDHGPFDPLW